ncbi:MAG TPA: M20/M25/M40 family metallo-hydrolase [Gemmatimonadales bacterium]|nr:M20/M25/M40 family metallo-hydrolase [Gemmatimonadales bacterium]
MSPSVATRRLAAGLVCLAACGPSTAPTPAPVVSAGEVREIVGALAADSMEGRRTGTPGSARAARFLAERMRSYGLEPGGDSSYFQRVPYEVVRGPEGEVLRLPGANGADSAGVERVTDYNLVGLIRGTDSVMRDEAVVLGAHFDHLGIGKPVEGDSIYNGADDDASGVATVLAAAQALAQAPPRRTVIVLLTSGEEFGVLGTQWYADRPVFPLSRTVAGLQVEMVGRPDSLAGGPDRLWLTGYERSTVGEALTTAGLPIVPDPRPSFRFFERSDNIVFALRGIPAHTLSSFGMHSDYHQPSDEVDRIDFAHLERAADHVTRAARLLADGPAPAWRIGGRPAPATP